MILPQQLLPTNMNEEPQSTPQLPEVPPPQPLEQGGKKKRLLSEKQRAALKAGREKRIRQMFEALERERDTATLSAPQPTNTEEAVVQEESQKLQSFLDPNSSSSSDSESALVYRRPQPEDNAETKLPRAVRRRIDRYIQRKLEESISTDVPQERFENPYLRHNIPRQPVYQFM